MENQCSNLDTPPTKAPQSLAKALPNWIAQNNVFLIICVTKIMFIIL